MRRLYLSETSDTPPKPPSNPAYGYPQNGSYSAQTLPTAPGAYWFHMVTEELLAVIEQAGLTPDETNLAQMAEAFSFYQNVAEASRSAANQALSVSEEALEVANSAIVQIHEIGDVDELRLCILASASALANGVNEKSLAHYRAYVNFELKFISEGIPTQTAAVNRLNEIALEKYDAYLQKELGLILALLENSKKSLADNRQNIRAYDASLSFRQNLLRNYDESTPLYLVVIAGQSNAVGTGGLPYEAAKFAGKFWDWSDQDSKALKAISDPLYPSKGHSPWPAFARTFFEMAGRKVLLLNVARGASGVTSASAISWYEDASTTSVCRTDATREWNALIAYLQDNNISYEFSSSVIWIQGEAECTRVANGRITVQDYIDGTLDVLSYFKTLTGDQKLKMYMPRTGFMNGVSHVGYDEVRAAQRQLASDNDDIVMVAEDLPASYHDAGMLYDEVHYNQDGYNSLGASFARYLAEEKFFIN